MDTKLAGGERLGAPHRSLSPNYQGCRAFTAPKSPSGLWPLSGEDPCREARTWRSASLVPGRRGFRNVGLWRCPPFHDDIKAASTVMTLLLFLPGGSFMISLDFLYFVFIFNGSFSASNCRSKGLKDPTVVDQTKLTEG